MAEGLGRWSQWGATGAGQAEPSQGSTWPPTVLKLPGPGPRALWAWGGPSLVAGW